MRKIILFLIATMVSTSFCYAQEQPKPKFDRLVKFPVLSINYFNYGESDFDSDIGKGIVSVEELSMRFQIVTPIKKNKWYLLNGLKYTYFNANTTFDTSNLNLNKAYHSIAYTLGVIKVLPKNWKLIVNFTPTIASDFENGLKTEDLFILQSSTLITKRANANFEYGFGLAYTNRFGSASIIPLVNITYKHGKWATFAILPAYLGHYYLFNKNTRLGAKFAVYGNLFNGSFNDNMAQDLSRLVYSRITIGPDLQTKLLGNFYINIGAGYATRNIVEIQNSDLNPVIELDVKDKFYFNIGIKFLK